MLRLPLDRVSNLIIDIESKNTSHFTGWGMIPGVNVSIIGTQVQTVIKDLVSWSPLVICVCKFTSKYTDSDYLYCAPFIYLLDIIGMQVIGQRLTLLLNKSNEDILTLNFNQDWIEGVNITHPRRYYYKGKFSLTEFINNIELKYRTGRDLFNNDELTPYDLWALEFITLRQSYLSLCRYKQGDLSSSKLISNYSNKVKEMEDELLKDISALIKSHPCI